MKNIIKKVLLEYSGNDSIYNFLRRRVKVTDVSRNDITIIKYDFEGFPEFGFTNFSTRKDVERKIMNFLFDNELISDELHDLYYNKNNKLNPELQSLIRSIRKFLNYINYES